MISVYRTVIGQAGEVGLGRRSVFGILALQGGSIVFEGIGLSMVLPIVQLIQADGDVARVAGSGGYWPYLIDTFGAVGLPVTFGSLLLVCFVLILIRQGFQYARRIYEARLQETRVQRLRTKEFDRYLTVATARHDEVALGEIINDLIVETPRAVAAVVCVVRVAGAALLVVFYLAVMSLLSVEMTATAIAIVALSVLLLKSLFDRSREASKNITVANRKVGNFLGERLRAARLIRLSGTEQAELDRMRELTQQQCDRVMRYQTLSARINTGLEPLVVAIAFIFLYFAVQVLHLPIAAIALFVLIIVRLTPVIREAVNMHQVVLGFSASLERIAQLLSELKQHEEPDTGRKRFASVDRGIAFENVTFRYGGTVDDHPAALEDVSCRIAAGQTTALVGPSGGGKSTMVDMLPRLRSPTGGRILIDGTPLDDFSLSSLRAGIAFVPQDPQLFNVTVREHIRYGKASASDAEIIEAARLADVDSFVGRLPDGYDSRLGEVGSRLSGGQRQRLDLARALVRRAPILILDEPTSNLDANAEEAFRLSLARIRQTTDITVIVIAHRFSTIMDADRIIVLENGRIIQSGTHADLANSFGWYATAFQQQQRSDGPAVVGL